MVKTAQSVCDNQETLTVAQLYNTAGAAYIELNKLDLCREGWETAKSIREDKLDPDHRLVASSFANLANLETAEENFQEARALLLHAAAIREKIGDSAATMLALTYLQIGRVDALEKKFPEALRMFQKSEALFNRQRGSANYLAE
jgi:tetratricopeptide (TPR) repeat protein